MTVDVALSQSNQSRQLHAATMMGAQRPSENMPARRARRGGTGSKSQAWMVR